MTVTFTVLERGVSGNSFIIAGRWSLSPPHIDGLIVQSISRREYMRNAATANITDYWEAWIVKNGQVQFIQPVDSLTLEITDANAPATWITSDMPANAYHDTFAGPNNFSGLVVFIAIAYWVAQADRNKVLGYMPLGGAVHAGNLPSCTANPLHHATSPPPQVLVRTEYLHK